jgi:hypothetical protein
MRHTEMQGEGPALRWTRPCQPAAPVPPPASCRHLHFDHIDHRRVGQLLQRGRRETEHRMRVTGRSPDVGEAEQLPVDQCDAGTGMGHW